MLKFPIGVDTVFQVNNQIVVLRATLVPEEVQLVGFLR